MPAARGGLFAVLLLVTTASSVTAKGPTSKITISSSSLSQPFTISDPKTLELFQIWSGATDAVGCVESICVDDSEGFIIDWKAGALADVPIGLLEYQIVFFTKGLRGADPEHVAYIVRYRHDPLTSSGYVYLPGRGDEPFTLNRSTISRGAYDGHWFHASVAWWNVVTPLLLGSK